MSELEQLRPGEAILVDWSAERYHADTQCVSRSMLEDIRREGTSYFEGRHITCEIDGPSSESMSFGTLAHLCTLEPEEWHRRVIFPRPERPDEADGRRRKGTPERAAYDSWQAQTRVWDRCVTDDAIPLENTERAVFERIAQKVRGHELCAAAFEDPASMAEQTAIWREPDTGVLIRARLDLLEPPSRRKPIVIVDLKTTISPLPGRGDSPGPFGRSAAKYGYHRQAALYGDVARALYPGTHVAFVIAAVRNKPPHEIVVYEVPEEAIELGRAQYRRALDIYIEHRDRGDWTADYEHELQTLTLPKWAYFED